MASISERRTSTAPGTCAGRRIEETPDQRLPDRRSRAVLRGAAGQRGLSLVELLVGSAVGLLIAAAASAVVTGSFRGNHSLQIESRLMQDLRATTDLMARDLRRAGYWGAAASGVWARVASATSANPYAAIATTGATSAAAPNAITFSFSRDAAENGLLDSAEQFGYRLHNGNIELQLGAGNWQALTDSSTLLVDTFSVRPKVDEVSLAAYCESACPTGSTTCPPRRQVRSVAIAIVARSAFDTRVIRATSSEVRLRNDTIVGACSA